MAFLLDANYCSVLDPTVPIPWFKVTLDNFGYFIYEPVLFLSGIALGIIVYFMLYGVRYLESKIKDTSWVEYGFLGFALLSFPLTLILNPDKISGPLWFASMVGLLVSCMLPSIIRRIIFQAKQKA